MTNALTVDVEDYYHAQALRGRFPPQEWERIDAGRVVAGTLRLADALAGRGIRATFFVLGFVAERHPGLVRTLVAEGHEIACHGYAHELIYRQGPRAFREDLARALDILRSLAGPMVRGYRAPSFSITPTSLWALDLLVEQGILYDSSIMPLSWRHDLYGLKRAPRFLQRLPNGLWEIPPSTVRAAGIVLPVGGGGYFRLYPYWATRWGLRRVNAEGHPAVVYIHSWEFDASQPRPGGLPVRSRLRHYVGLTRVPERFERLLADFPFAPMREVFPALAAPGPPG